MTRIGNKLCAIVTVLIISSAAVGTEVALRDQFVVNTTVIRLGDVADFPTEADVRTRYLAKLPLMPAPAPGTERFLRLREIEDLLAAHGEDMTQIRFMGANQVKIVAPKAEDVIRGRVTPVQNTNSRAAIMAAGRRAAPAEPMSLDPGHAESLREEISQTVIDYLVSKAGQADAWTVNIEVIDRQLALAKTATSEFTCKGGSEPFTGRQRFVVSFNTADGTVNLPVPADVSLVKPIVVALRQIEKGAVVTAADVEVRRIDNGTATLNRRTPAETIDELVGMEAKQQIRPGDVVYSDLVRAALLVKRGEIVSVVSQGGGIRVRTTARAKSDGARGDLIQVESLSTKEKFDVFVTGTRTAAVFAGVLPPAAKPVAHAETVLRLKK